MTSNSKPIKAFDGKCAFGVCIGKNDVPGKEEITITQDGKKYYFSNSAVKLIWRLIPSLKKRAEKNWASN